MHTGSTSATAASAAVEATAVDPVLRPLDEPLPPELTGRTHGWLTGYRRYPVFSAPWVRGRLRGPGSLTVLVMAVLALPMFWGPVDRWPLGGIAQLTVQVLVPLLLGPWLASWVRRRGWPAPLEWRALAATMAAVVLLLLAFHQWGAEPLKQMLAEWTGQVEADGRRKRMVMQIGIIVSDPESPASAPRPPPPGELPPMVQAFNFASSVLVSFLLAGGAGLWGWQRERRGLLALQRERELARAQAARREAELRLSVLAAQVEPHFLFNTLAGVRSAIATDPARASEMVDRLVDYLRAAIPRLRSDGGSAATLAGQLDIVRAYLGLMAARMPRLSWTIDVAPELLGAACPPLMLISLAENAVKHGVEPKIGPVHVEVRAGRTADGRLEITVADDGAGFGTSGSGGGLGLTNIRERLQQMHGDRAALVLKARPEGGVAATLTLPVE